MTTPSQTAANQANAKHSTGPKSQQGKSRSAENALRHGLASGRLIIPGECKAEYEALEADLLKRHRPADITETLLVQEMAQSYWLKERAIRLQAKAFTESDNTPKDLALLMRYQITNQRAFHTALDTLTKLQNQRKKDEIGFESQRQYLKAEIHRLKHLPKPEFDPEKFLEDQDAAKRAAKNASNPVSSGSSSVDNSAYRP
jgi:hypothetical protein